MSNVPRIAPCTVAPALPNQPNVMDGRALLAGLEPGSAAAVLFDPQYRGVLDKLGYGNEGARQRRRARLEAMSEPMIAEFIRAIDRALKPSGYLFLWLDKFHLCQGVDQWMADTELSAVDLVTWDKGRIGMGYRTRRKSEYLKIYQKTPIKARGTWNRHDIPDSWTERVDPKPHAHVKPFALQAAVIEAVTRPGDIVVDPSAGSYSVLECCKSIGQRIFFGADILPPEACALKPIETPRAKLAAEKAANKPWPKQARSGAKKAARPRLRKDNKAAKMRRRRAA